MEKDLFMLENKHYLRPEVFKERSADFAANTLNFLKWFNEEGQFKVLTTGEQDSNQVICILLSLKKNISYALKSLGKSLNKKRKIYICSVCKAELTINPFEDVWDVLESHEHFYQLYSKLKNGELETISFEQEDVAKVMSKNGQIVTDNIPLICSSNEPYFESVMIQDQETTEVLDKTLLADEKVSLVEDFQLLTSNEEETLLVDNKIAMTDEKVSLDENLLLLTSNEIDMKTYRTMQQMNGFKFNFKITYDKVINDALHPDWIIRIVPMKAITVRRISRQKVYCFLCLCDIYNPKDVSKSQVLNHMLGNKHLRNSNSPEILETINNFHEFFIKQELISQAQTIFFVPFRMTSTKCILCNVEVPLINEQFEDHINSEKHLKFLKHVCLINKTEKLFSHVVIDILTEGFGFNVAITKDNKLIGVENGRNVESKKGKLDVVTKSISNAVLKPQKEKKSSKREEHKIVLSVKDKKSAHISERIPRRYIDHLQLLTKNSENIYTCNACGLIAGMRDQEVKCHFQSKVHQRQSDLPRKRYFYYCGLCDIVFHEEELYEKHLLNRHDRHSSDSKLNSLHVEEFECLTCSSIIFGDQNIADKHLSRIHKKQKDKKLPESVKSLFRSEQVIKTKGEKLKILAEIVVEHDDSTMLCCQELENTLSQSFPGCRAYPFGSRISGFGDQNSDLDVFMDTGDMYNGIKHQDTLSQVQFVKKSTNLFGKLRNDYDYVCSIASARTPIVKVLHKATGLDCDISFKHGLSVENTKFLKYCIKIQPILQPVVLLLKQWCDFCRLRDHISTYGLALMTIFYMQVENYLPSVVKLRLLSKKPQLLIDGWNRFDDTVPLDAASEGLKQCDMSYKDLLKGFFTYYANFNYPSDVICPLLGTTLKKDLFTESGELLPIVEMRTYILKIRSETEPEYFRNRSELCIQDPFDLSHNLTKACSIAMVNKWKKMCELTKLHLSAL